MKSQLLEQLIAWKLEVLHPLRALLSPKKMETIGKLETL